jgi:hypothetical protein
MINTAAPRTHHINSGQTTQRVKSTENTSSNRGNGSQAKSSKKRRPQ